MNGEQDPEGERFVVTPQPHDPAHGNDEDVGTGFVGLSPAGGTWIAPGERRRALGRHVANPDDPPVPLSLRDRPARPPAPDSYFLGRMAIVQGQIYLVGLIFIVQLWLITLALWELLSGRPQAVWGIALASGIGFVIALVVALWPRRRVRGQ
jgi:hypothetical protein